MADKEQLAEIKRGAKAWNAWRASQAATLGVDLRGADLRFGKLAGANLREAKLGAANLKGANLREANLREANLQGADLSGAKLERADMTQANLHRAELHEARVSQAKLVAAKLVRANLEGADLREAVLRQATLQGADLFVANLSGADLRKADLRGAEMSGVNLLGANLNGAHLGGAKLCEAKLVAAKLVGANLEGADLSGANLEEANIRHARLVETSLEHASLLGCAVYGISAWNVALEGAVQTNLSINRADEPTITVDNLEVAQFLYLMLHNQKIRDILDTLTSKVVLILGRFTPERKAVLEALREALRQRNYVPVLFDFEGPESHDFTETVTLLARMARFIIADLTEPASIPHELQAIVPDVMVPVQPLIAADARPFAMFVDHRKYHWMLPIYRYPSLEGLLATLQEQVIAPVEAKAREIRKLRQAEEE